MIFAMIITLGFYEYYWFFDRKNQLNQLRSEKKITWEPAVLLLGPFALYPAGLITGMLLGVLQKALAIDDSILGSILVLLFLAAIIFYVFTYFRIIYRMRAILNDHMGEKRVGPILTFFFGKYYLQYHINRLIKREKLANAQLANANWRF